jgi:probable HAF family extracellular repeat protein
MLYRHYLIVFYVLGLVTFNAEAGPPVYYTVTDLGSFLGSSGPDYSYGRGINASGQVTGFSQSTSGDWHAFLYSNGQIVNDNRILTHPMPKNVKVNLTHP